MSYKRSLADLPPDIILRCLDFIPRTAPEYSESVRNALLIFPQLTQWCRLVTAKQDDRALFFDVPGIRHLSVTEFVEQGLGSAEMTLIELSEEEAIASLDDLMTADPRLFGSRTLLRIDFTGEHPKITKLVDWLETRVKCYELVREQIWVNERERYLREMGAQAQTTARMHHASEFGMTVTHKSLNLRWIVLDDIPGFINDVSFPLASHIKIRFRPEKLQPTITRFEAPLCTDFRVHFTYFLPNFTMVNVCSKKISATRPTSFELSDTRTLRFLNDERYTGTVDWRFYNVEGLKTVMERFTQVYLLGVPVALLQFIKHQTHLYFRNACKFNKSRKYDPLDGCNAGAVLPNTTQLAFFENTAYRNSSKNTLPFVSCSSLNATILLRDVVWKVKSTIENVAREKLGWSLECATKSIRDSAGNRAGSDKISEVRNDLRIIYWTKKYRGVGNEHLTMIEPEFEISSETATWKVFKEET
ncbi:CYFA0S11e01211g1_1 [Cyberlindnera fabianii]|uniref:CYFA0S11e01211g1_1 n=1 Tax=Cyberlindnera fabianii TaxID=36022 RepID=A0A061B6A2_CYBFA|nr:CYFA0S11e01211g1_1 [Cyberlindnera fabianii]